MSAVSRLPAALLVAWPLAVGSAKGAQCERSDSPFSTESIMHQIQRQPQEKGNKQGSESRHKKSSAQPRCGACRKVKVKAATAGVTLRLLMDDANLDSQFDRRSVVPLGPRLIASAAENRKVVLRPPA